LNCTATTTTTTTTTTASITAAPTVTINGIATVPTTAAIATTTTAVPGSRAECALDGCREKGAYRCGKCEAVKYCRCVFWFH
jgi:hypothetical protein